MIEKQFFMKIYRLIIFIFIFSGLNSCHVVDEKTLDDVFIPDPTIVVRADLRGIVKDFDGNSLNGASVRIGNETTTSDSYGYFKFENILITAGGALLEVTSNGFLKAQKLVTPQAGDNYLQIRLVKLNASDSFSGSSGGLIALNDGASVQFLANSIIEEDGSDYNGMVNVSSYYLSPVNPYMAELMPGSLRGFKEDGSLTILATLGMIYVELTDNSGQQLEIKEEYKSILKFPIPTAYQSTAPTIMPMWTFNNETGFWEEEGQATLSGDFYEANVSHFSWWNADWPYNPIALKGTLVYDNVAQARTAIQNVALRISLLDRPWSSSTVYTNTAGTFCAEIPQSNRVKLEVINDCGEVAYNFEVGPFGSASDLGEVVIDYTALPLMEVSGNMVDCGFEPIGNGYAIIQYGEGYSIAEVDENGYFSALIPRCNNSDSITVRGFDAINFVESIIVSFENNSTNLYVGELIVCTNLIDIISIRIEGETYIRQNVIGLPTSFTGKDYISANGYISEFSFLSAISNGDNNFMSGFFGFEHTGIGEQYEVDLIDGSSITLTGAHELSFTNPSDPLKFEILRVVDFDESSISISNPYLLIRKKIEFTSVWEDNFGDSYQVEGYFVTSGQ